MDSAIRIVAIPPEIWKKEFSDLARDALVSERRIQKDSNIEVERARYGLFCYQIESGVMRLLPKISDDHIRELNAHYLDILASLSIMAEKDEELQDKFVFGRLGTSFTSPEKMGSHIRYFEELAQDAGLEDDPAVISRLSFLRRVQGLTDEQEGGYGIVEIQSPFHLPDQSHPPVHLPRLKQQKESIQPSSIKYIDRIESTNLYDSLREEIQQALESGQGVNFSNPPHVVITEILHEYVYDQSEEGQRLVRVLYDDGSEGAPFPLFALSGRSSEEAETILDANPVKASLISMRHLDMDAKVDMAWFSNQQASRSRPFAETDAFCYQRTMEQLQQLKNPIQLRLYQTGLQPAVVGFYRALVDWLRQWEQKGISPKLVVVPMYHRRSGSYSEGKSWY